MSEREGDGASRISRREFLAAGGAGVAAAALGAVPFAASAAQEKGKWDHEADVVVVGTGGAGAVAAIMAHEAGATVRMLEKAPIFGGTTGKSAAGIWVPNNFLMKKAGIEDPREDLIRFLARYSYPGLYDPESPTFGLSRHLYDLLGAYYDNASPMIDDLVRMGMRMGRFHTAPPDVPDVPDYFEHAKENKAPRGRALGPLRKDGRLGAGDELIGQLQAIVDERKIPVLLGHRVVRLVLNGKREAVGVEATDAEGKTVTVRAAKAVVFGTGGYTNNRELVRIHQVNPVYGGCGVPTCTGDFIAIASAAGAQLGNMGGAWRTQIVLEEVIQHVSVPNEVWQPPGDSMFIVNKYGHRVVNEKRNYHDRSKVHFVWDPNEVEYPNQLLFMIYDERTAVLYGGGYGGYPLPGEPTAAPYVIVGDTLDSLSDGIGKRLEKLSEHTGNVRLAPDFARTLRQTFDRFNRFAERGKDEDFQRGEFAYDVEWIPFFVTPKETDRWKLNEGKNVTMHPLQPKGPYYAIILVPGTLDTNGGPVIDAGARVLAADGRPIPGLYGAGNCVAAAAGDTYWGAGATIGNAMTFGYVAGRNAAKEPVKSV